MRFRGSPRWTNQLLKQLIFYTNAICVNILIVGNILNIGICLRKTIRREMLAFYNILISILNILVLVISLAQLFPLTFNLNYYLTSTSDQACALLTFTGRVSIQMSAWLYVFMSIDRFICVVTFNENLKRILVKKKNVSLILLGLFGFVMVINVPNLFYRIQTLGSQTNVTNKCSPPNSTLILVRNLEIGAFRVILPVSLQILFSFLLIKRLFSTRQKANMIGGDMERQYRFTKIIVYLNVSILLTEMPILVMSAYFGFIGASFRYPIDATTASKSFARATLAFYISDMIGAYMFGSVFFVNVATNRLFQDEIKKMFKVCF